MLSCRFVNGTSTVHYIGMSLLELPHVIKLLNQNVETRFTFEYHVPFLNVDFCIRFRDFIHCLLERILYYNTLCFRLNSPDKFKEHLHYISQHKSNTGYIRGCSGFFSVVSRYAFYRVNHNFTIKTSSLNFNDETLIGTY